MTTQLQLVNFVLGRMRENEVTTIPASTSSKLIAQFVNQAKQEVEDRWDWLHLRTTIAIVTVASTFRYILTGAGQRWRLLRDHSTNPVGWDVYNDTQDYNLTKAPASAWMTRQLLTQPQTGDPIWFDINGQSGGDPQVDLYPIPPAGQTINFNMVIPQADFTLTGTDNSTVLTVPDLPVLLRAYDLARTERGEDGSTSPTERQKQYVDALWSAVLREMQLNTEETTASIA